MTNTFDTADVVDDDDAPCCSLGDILLLFRLWMILYISTICSVFSSRKDKWAGPSTMSLFLRSISPYDLLAIYALLYLLDSSIVHQIGPLLVDVYDFGFYLLGLGQLGVFSS